MLYRGALRYLQSGDAPRAAALLAKTVARTAASPRPEDDRLQRAARKRLFAVSMEAGRAELEAGRPAKAAEHFLSARTYAADVSAHVEASIQLARVRLIRKEDSEAVGEYQRLLLEHGEDSVEGARVFDLARNAITATLAVLGREAYEVHEAAAAALLAEARRSGTADALQKVFRLYPNSLAAEEALFEAEAAQAKVQRPDDQISALRTFLREYPDSARAPEAHARLVRALEAKGHTASAGALLRRMLRLFPDAPVEDGGANIPAKEFAERRLKTEAYSRAPGGVAVSRLTPQLTKRFEVVDKDFPEGGIPLKVAGAIPPGVLDLVLLHYTAPTFAAVSALDDKGARIWQLKLKSQVRFAAFIEEALLVADDQQVTRLNPRTGVVEWQYDSKFRMNGFAVSGPLLLFVVEDPDSRIVALEAVRGSSVWSQPFEGRLSSRIHPAGESVVFTTVNPNRIQLFEVETGRRLLANAPFPSGLGAQVVYVADDVLVIHAEGRFLEAYDLPSGRLRWRQVMTFVSTRGLEPGADGLILLGTRRPASGIDEKLFLQTISLRTGKVVKYKEPGELGNALFMLVDGDQVVVISREPDKTITVRGVSLADFSIRWSTPLGGRDATLYPPLLSKDHLVVGAFVEDTKAAKYTYTVWLLDKSGRVVQNMNSDRFERPPAFLGVAHDRLVVCVESKVEVHR